MTAPLRVALYVRQSVDATGMELAITRQEKACRDYVAMRYPTARIVVVHQENDTSAMRKRPVFDGMLADARSGAFDLIVAYHLDRLTRSLKDWLPLVELARDYGVGTTTTAGDLDLTTDAGRLVGGILSVVANGEVERKGDRQRLANESRARAGLPSKGSRPFGYESDGQTVRPSEAAAVATAYDALLAGASLGAITRDLNAAGFGTGKSGRPWSVVSVRALLCNPRNAGLRAYRKEIIGPAVWPALVPEPLWRSALAVLQDPARTTNRVGGQRRWLGSGLYGCGVCGDTLLIAGTSGSSRQQAYRCRSSKHLVRDAGAVDTFVVDMLLERCARADAADLLVDPQQPGARAAHVEATALRQRLDAMAEDYADGLLSRAQLVKGTSKLRAALADAEALMSHSVRAPLMREIVQPGDLAAVRAVWDGLDLDRKRAVLLTLADVTVDKGRVGGTTAQRRMDPRIRLTWKP
jgi:site-specific DNA recombinase